MNTSFNMILQKTPEGGSCCSQLEDQRPQPINLSLHALGKRDGLHCQHKPVVLLCASIFLYLHRHLPPLSASLLFLVQAHTVGHPDPALLESCATSRNRTTQRGHHRLPTTENVCTLATLHICPTYESVR